MKKTFDVLVPLAGLFMIAKGWAGLSEKYYIIPTLEICAGLLTLHCFLRFIQQEKDLKSKDEDLQKVTDRIRINEK